MENADRFGGGPLLGHLQRTAEVPERGHEPVVTKMLVIRIAAPKTHYAAAATQGWGTGTGRVWVRGIRITKGALRHTVL